MVDEGGDVAVVAHGIVLTLLLRSLLDLSDDEAVGTWNSIRFPDVAAIDVETKELVRAFGG